MPSSDLVTYIFTNTRLPLAVQFAEWVQASPRFRAFAETYRDKIRRKVRGITEAEGYSDLQAELATAYFLASERRFAVEYEKYGLGKQRGPDFSVTYKTHIRFDVEVTRVHGSHSSADEAAELNTAKLASALCSKLGQLPPSMINILVLVVDAAPYTEDSLVNGLGSAVKLLQERVGHKDDEFFVRRGFLGARDFVRQYGRLSAIRMVAPGVPAVLRLQTGTRHPLPSDLASILRR